MKRKLLGFGSGLLLKALVVANLFAVICAQTGPQTVGTCRGSGCPAISRAELFLKAFASSGRSHALRTSNLEQEEKVRLAFYGIDATRVEIERGRLSESEGNFIIDGHKQVIRNYLQDNTNESMVRAAGGQVLEIPAIKQSLRGLLSVARQDALMGHEDLAMQAQTQMVKILTTFSQKFAETCEQQSFPQELPLVLERQNQMFESGISLEHCMNRKFTAELNNQGIRYDLETCSNLSNASNWKLKISGRVVGMGSGSTNRWEADVVYQDTEHQPSGRLKIFTQELEEEDNESPAVPDDAGPNAKPNGWPSAPIPDPPPRFKKRTILKLGMTTILLKGSRGFCGWTISTCGFASQGSNWVEAEMKQDGKPCNPVTEHPSGEA